MSIDHSTRWTLTITKDGRVRLRTDVRWAWHAADAAKEHDRG